MKIILVRLDCLKEHERVRFGYLDELTGQIIRDGYIKDPIIVDKNSMIILDGHHRFNAAKKIGLNKIPVLLVDYTNANIQVASWRKEENINKKDVLKAGLTGKLLKPKTSKHKIPCRPSNLNIPLFMLK